jgi:alcohol dehydrogenase class IV
MVDNFSASGVPELMFGRGVFDALGQHTIGYGVRLLLVGDQFLQHHPGLFKEVEDKLVQAGHVVQHVLAGEKQSDEAAEAIIECHNIESFDVVVSIGGGRAIDTGKIVAKKLPHIAVPTTAGTGAPMNGVIFGGHGAHEETQRRSLLPSLVVADPAFIDEMDRDDFAARALGVLMLLIEAYVSPKASVLSDSLVWSGLEAFAKGFVAGVEGDHTGRDDVFFASLMAGVGSGQAGFGLTHRMGVLIEQMSELTYAQACSTLCAEICDFQIQLLSDRLPDSEAMDKYALVGELLASRPFEDREEAYASLVGTLRRWVSRLEIAKINIAKKDQNDIKKRIMSDWDDVVLPVRLDSEDIREILLRRSAHI